MNQETGLTLTNEYAKDYYDRQVGPLESYTNDRWHSSPVREFEYRQMERAISRAIGGRRYERALEVGPGDGVWTAHTKQQVTGSIHLVEQSEEMLKRARERFSTETGITYERSDFQSSNPPGPYDLITAIRCFEYFDDKPGALRKMRSLLAPGGRLVLITKNAKLVTGRPVQGQTLHSDQLAKDDMRRLATESGLTIERIYPAVLRWKANIGLMRFVFDIFQRIGVATEGALPLPPFDPYATESYVYILRAS